jgi:predicted ATPase
VWLVELAPLIDAALVTSAVASVVGARHSPGLEPTAAVCRVLAHKRALIVLDNCEHVVDSAASFVDRLLSEAPRVRVLATSREPLDVAGESVWRVPSLTVDTPDGFGDAAALFAERAAQVRDGFALDESNLADVLALCRRLDGIPLAIELAAARVRVMSIEQIAARLDERFRLLTRGGRTAVARQQTLQGAIDWSYELLAPREREVFEALGVFAGEFDLVAAAAVAGMDEYEVLDLIEQLIDKSMLEADPTRDRYRLLETLRQYAWDRLVSSGGLASVRNRHAAHYATLAAEQAALMSVAGRQVEALDRLELDYDNLRAALMHLIERRDAGAAVRLVRRLGGLFAIRHPREGFGWFEQVIALADDLPAKTRARLLGDAAQAAMTAGHMEAHKRLAEIAVDIGGVDAPAIAHWQLASWCLWKRQLNDCIEHAQRSLATAVATNDLTTQITAIGTLVMAFAGLGDDAAARSRIPELIELAERQGNPTITATYFAIASSSLAHLGHVDEAIGLCAAGLAQADAGGPITAAYVRTIYAMEVDDPRECGRLLRVALPIAKNQLWGHFLWDALVPSAKFIAIDRPALAAQLLGTYARCSDESGFIFDGYTDGWVNRLRSQLVDTLGRDALDDLVAKGREITIDHALQLALDEISRDVSE